jgi:hypothetical protein
MMTHRRVIIESPYAADTTAGIEENLIYARCCIRDSLLRSEAPLAPHLVYPLVFDDNIQTERTMGIRAGLTWAEVADATVAYVDHGISEGMQIAIDDATRAGRPVEYRRLGETPRIVSIAAQKRKAEITPALVGLMERHGGLTQRRGS